MTIKGSINTANQKEKPKSKGSQTKNVVSAIYWNSLNNTIMTQVATHGITVSFRTNNKRSSLLKQNHQNYTNNKDKTGVYKMNGNNGPKHYIAQRTNQQQTRQQRTRSFGMRFKDHIPSRESNLNSAFATHLADSNYPCTSLDNNLVKLHIYATKKEDT